MSDDQESRSDLPSFDLVTGTFDLIVWLIELFFRLLGQLLFGFFEG